MATLTLQDSIFVTPPRPRQTVANPVTNETTALVVARQGVAKKRSAKEREAEDEASKHTPIESKTIRNKVSGTPSKRTKKSLFVDVDVDDDAQDMTIVLDTNGEEESFTDIKQQAWYHNMSSLMKAAKEAAAKARNND